MANLARGFTGETSVMVVGIEASSRAAAVALTVSATRDRQAMFRIDANARGATSHGRETSGGKRASWEIGKARRRWNDGGDGSRGLENESRDPSGSLALLHRSSAGTGAMAGDPLPRD